MPTPSLRLTWAEHEVVLSPDGTRVSLCRGDVPVLDLHVPTESPLGASAVDADEAEHSFVRGGLRVHQRHAVGESWRWRWVVVNESSAPLAVDLALELVAASGWSVWCWAAGAAGLITVSPRTGAGPVLAIRLEQGHLESGGTPTVGDGLPGLPVGESPGLLRLAPTDLRLEPGQRWVVTANARWMPDLATAAALLPPWLEPVALPEGEPWGARLADVGVTVSEPARTWYDDVAGVVWVVGPPGRHEVGVHGPNGVTRLALDWAWSLDDALSVVAGRALAERGEGFTAAGAFCVQAAVDRSLLAGTTEVHDALDRFDWTRRTDLIAIAFGIARATAEGEAAMVGEALRSLASLRVEVGYGRVVMRAWLASLGVGTDAHQRCLALLGRQTSDATAALESSLLHYRSADAGESALAGLVGLLGGDLPGEPIGVGWADQARLVGLLELCPQEWPLAAYAGRTAEKTRRRILAAYADGRVRSAEPLAWLLLGAVG